MGWPFWQPGGRRKGTLSSLRAGASSTGPPCCGSWGQVLEGDEWVLDRFKRRVEQAWRMRWSWLLGCAVAKAVAGSLLEMQGCVGTDGASPAGHEVEGDFRCAGLAA